MPQPAIETILMSQSGLKYAEVACIVTRCRSSLGMERFAPWNDSLLAECERLIQKEKGAATTNEALLDVETFFGIRESSASSHVRSKVAFADNTVNCEALSRFFGQKIDAGSNNRRGSAVGNNRQASFRNLLGRRASQKSMSSLKSDISFEHAPSTKNLEATVYTSSPTKTAKTFRPPNTTSSEPSMMIGPDVVAKGGGAAADTREHHLTDPIARETPLEALIVRRFGIGFEDAICLVSDARSELRESKFTPWTDDLYFECEKALGVYSTDQTSRTEDLSNSSRSSGSRDMFVTASEGKNAAAAAPKEINFEASPRAKRDNDDQSVGYNSTSGYSGIWSDDKDGDYSVATHDRDDVYSVGVIRGFKASVEGGGDDDTAPRNIRVKQSRRHSKSSHRRDSSSMHSRSVPPIDEGRPVLDDTRTTTSKSERSVHSRGERSVNSKSVNSKGDTVYSYKPLAQSAVGAAPLSSTVPSLSHPVGYADRTQVKPEQARPTNTGAATAAVDVGCCGLWFARRGPAAF
jgi:hypothetical protein